MFNGNFTKKVLLAAIALAAAANAIGAEHFFEVHGEAYNPEFGMQPWVITMDGEALVAPTDACGMVFEGDSVLHWYSDNFGLHDTIEIEFDGKYAADVYLPGPSCGSWPGTVVENVDEVDNVPESQYTPPFDFSGAIEADATGYWTDGENPSHKLVYLHQPCQPAPQCFLGGQDLVTNGWSQGLSDPIRNLDLALSAINRGDSTASTLLQRASAALAAAARDQDARIRARRQYNTRTLEPSIRQLEDIARARLASAQGDASTASNYLRLGKRDAAYRACNGALLNTKSARGALDTADSWVE